MVPTNNNIKTDSPAVQWERVCRVDDLIPNIGVRALLGKHQVAIFKVAGQEECIYAIDAFDPFSEAAVLSRGIVGDLQGQLVVASPIYKQHFNLQTGQCLEDEAVKLQTFATRVVDGQIELAYPDAE